MTTIGGTLRTPKTAVRARPAIFCYRGTGHGDVTGQQTSLEPMYRIPPVDDARHACTLRYVSVRHPVGTEIVLNIMNTHTHTHIFGHPLLLKKSECNY